MAGGYTTPALVAAVSEAGGLGTFGLTAMSVEAAAAAVRAGPGPDRRADRRERAGGAAHAPGPPRAATRVAALRAFRRELGLPDEPPAPPRQATPRELVAASLEAGAGAVSVGLGDPGDVHDLARDAGVPLIAMASRVDDAVRCARSGADVVVAQGAEAGGHRSSFDLPEDGEVPLIGTFALVPQVVRAVGVPVVAAGGVMDGRGLAAALALGAQGVQMGSRFLVAAESGVPEGYKRRLREAHDVDTIITRAVSGRPARGLPNRLMAALEAAGPPALGYPRQAAASADLRAAAAAADRPDLIALWAGQAAGLTSDPDAGGARSWRRSSPRRPPCCASSPARGYGLGPGRRGLPGRPQGGDRVRVVVHGLHEAGRARAGGGIGRQAHGRDDLRVGLGRPGALGLEARVLQPLRPTGAGRRPRPGRARCPQRRGGPGRATRASRRARRSSGRARRRRPPPRRRPRRPGSAAARPACRRRPASSRARASRPRTRRRAPAGSARGGGRGGGWERAKGVEERRRGGVQRGPVAAGEGVDGGLHPRHAGGRRPTPGGRGAGAGPRPAAAGRAAPRAAPGRRSRAARGGRGTRARPPRRARCAAISAASSAGGSTSPSTAAT